MKHFYITTFLLLCTQIAFSQSVAKITDATTGEVVPFANIAIGKENLISNSEGYFTLPDTDSATPIVVSCIGYLATQTTIGKLEASNFTIRLEPAMYELDDVNVARPDANTIMANVKQNLARHYTQTIPVAKDLLFVRETNHIRPSKMQIEITKSTGFSKKALQEANSDLNAFTAQMKSHPPLAFTDVLCNHYLPSSGAAKLEVIKATKLRNQNRSTSFEEIEKNFATTMLKHLDTMKYYRIKSGWIGSRDTISMRKDFNKKKKKKTTAPDEVVSSKGKLAMFLGENGMLNKTKMTFVTQPELYEYTYDGATFMGDEMVYVLQFKPRKSKANYNGTLYVSASDYAILRTDYALAKGKTEGGLNLKLILGIKVSENVSNGTTIYKQNPSGEGYYLQYAAIETGQYFYLNRPLKFIELTDEVKDVVAFDIKVEGDIREKTEYLNISRNEVAASDFSNVNEPKFSYQMLNRYDPSIWAAYSAIEPLEEMKRFTAPE